MHHIVRVSMNKLHAWLKMMYLESNVMGYCTLQACSQPCMDGGSILCAGKCLHVEAAQQWETWKKISPFFLVINKSSHSNFMPCTAQALVSVSTHNTTLALLLIPAVTCSYMLYIYSSHMRSLSSFRGFDRTPWAPLWATGLLWHWPGLVVSTDCSPFFFIVLFVVLCFVSSQPHSHSPLSPHSTCHWT